MMQKKRENGKKKLNTALRSERRFFCVHVRSSCFRFDIYIYSATSFNGKLIYENERQVEKNIGTSGIMQEVILSVIMCNTFKYKICMYIFHYKRVLCVVYTCFATSCAHL